MFLIISHYEKGRIIIGEKNKNLTSTTRDSLKKFSGSNTCNLIFEWRNTKCYNWIGCNWKKLLISLMSGWQNKDTYEYVLKRFKFIIFF